MCKQIWRPVCTFWTILGSSLLSLSSVNSNCSQNKQVLSIGSHISITVNGISFIFWRNDYHEVSIF